MKGLVHIYTGDGKGKTTAAVGLAIRAIGHNKKVVFITFGKKKSFYGEYSVLKKLKVPMYNYASGYPCFVKNVDVKKLKYECKKGVNKILSLYKQNFDLIIIDEILVCVRDKFLSIKNLKEVITKKPDNVELSLTGRCNKEILRQIKDKVDYITIMKKVKHPYDKDVMAREGIEF